MRDEFKRSPKGKMEMRLIVGFMKDTGWSDIPL